MVRQVFYPSPSVSTGYSVKICSIIEANLSISERGFKLKFGQWYVIDFSNTSSTIDKLFFRITQSSNIEY